MSREIKFRAWDGQEMWLSSSSSEGLHHLATWLDAHSTGWFDGKKEDHTIMEFTGEKDKHGRDIYENDVVLVNGGESGFEFVSHIVFDKAAFHIHGAYGQGIAGQHIEVIGNIYENPEILKEENGKR